MPGPLVSVGMLVAAIAQLLVQVPVVTSSIDVEVDGVAACDGRGLEHEVNQRVAASGGSDEFTRAVVVLRDEDGVWTADVEVSTRSGSGSRRLTANSCDALVDDVAFVLTFAARGDGTGPPAQSEPDDALETGAADPNTPEYAADPDADVPAPSVFSQPSDGPSTGRTSTGVRRRGALDLVTGGGVHVLSLPNVGAVVGVGLGWQRDRWRAEVGYLSRVQREVRYQSNRGVRLSTHEAQARACFVPRIPRGPRATFCAGTAVGSFHARGTGSLIPRSGAKVWWTGLASAGLRWRGTRWLAIGPDVMLDLPILRPGASVEGDGTVATVGPVGLSTMLVLQWTLRREKNKGSGVSADGGKP